MWYRGWLASMLCVTILGTASAQFSNSGTGNLRVHVLWADSDHPAPKHLLVQLMEGSSTVPVQTSYTNDTGWVDFGRLSVGDYHIVVSGDDIQRNAANEGRAGLIGIQIVVPVGKPEIAIVAVAARDVHVVAGIEHESGSLQIRLAGKGQCAYVVHGVNDASLIVGDEAGVGGIYLRNTRIVALVSLDLE